MNEAFRFSCWAQIWESCEGLELFYHHFFFFCNKFLWRWPSADIIIIYMTMSSSSQIEGSPLFRLGPQTSSLHVTSTNKYINILPNKITFFVLWECRFKQTNFFCITSTVHVFQSEFCLLLVESNPYAKTPILKQMCVCVCVCMSYGCTNAGTSIGSSIGLNREQFMSVHAVCGK